jgi:hypothetical protein
LTQENDPKEDEELARKLNALMGPPLPPRRRGPRRIGFARALDIADEFYVLVRAGETPWRAKKLIAGRRGITPQHVSARIKEVQETDPYEYTEPDRTEPWE